jgi:hypothetical protein
MAVALAECSVRTALLSEGFGDRARLLEVFELSG